MRKVVFGFLVGIYFIISILVTTCLLTYNDYRVSVFGNTSLVIVDDDTDIGGYDKGTLLFIKKDIDKVDKEQEIIYYNTYDGNSEISVSKINDIEKVTDNEYTFVLENGNYLSSEFFIGAMDQIDSYAIIGGILAFFESRWGYLFFIILPILIFFIVEVMALIQELKPKKKVGKKNETIRKGKR